jgi:hypothetical protein
MIEENIEHDLKQSMLDRDHQKTSALRNLKSVILYFKISKGSRNQRLDDLEVIDLLSKELKKRLESVELYKKGNNQEKANAELYEVKVIESYLPPKMSDQEIDQIIDEVVKEKGKDIKNMGLIISQVKLRTVGRVDGAIIASKVKEKIT